MKFLKILGILILCPLAGLVFLAVIVPEEDAAHKALRLSAKEHEEAKNSANKLDAMVADSTLYLPPAQMKLMPYLRQGAELLMHSGKCDTIETASISEKSNPKDPLFYYHCGSVGDKNYGTFKLKVSEIKAQNLKIAPPPSWESSYASCEAFVRHRLNFPSTYDSNLFKTASRTFSDGRREVVIDFKAKNGLGMELPGSARCLFLPKKDGSYTMEGHINQE